MKKIFKSIGCRLCLLALAPLGVLTASAQQNTSLTSFQTTNVIAGATATVVAFPTNGNTGIYTGTPVSIANYDSFNVDVQGLLINTSGTASQAQVWLCFSDSQNQPNIVLATNAWSNNALCTNQNDWFTNTQVLLTVPLPPASTNWFHWGTNLSNTTLAVGATYVGVYEMSNNLPSNSCLTNGSGALISITKKPKVVKFP